MVERRYKAFTRELSAFGCRGNSSLVLTRTLFVNNEIYKLYLLNSRVQGVSGKMNNLPKHHGVGPPEVRGSMQLHRLKAGPGFRDTIHG